MLIKANQGVKLKAFLACMVNKNLTTEEGSDSSAERFWGPGCVDPTLTPDIFVRVVNRFSGTLSCSIDGFHSSKFK